MDNAARYEQGMLVTSPSASLSPPRSMAARRRAPRLASTRIPERERAAARAHIARIRAVLAAHAPTEQRVAS
jgi:hypothetical protein